jgi:hypothetical protein
MLFLLPLPKVFSCNPSVVVSRRPGQQRKLEINGGRRTEQILPRSAGLTQRTGGRTVQRRTVVAAAISRRPGPAASRRRR